MHGIDIDEAHACALLHKLLDQGRTDARGTAGDEHRAIFQAGVAREGGHDGTSIVFDVAILELTHRRQRQGKYPSMTLESRLGPHWCEGPGAEPPASGS